KVLAGLNDGQGPDILAGAEGESEGGADLLALGNNPRLSKPALHYQNIAFKEPPRGRNIATAVITPRPHVRDKAGSVRRRQRILEVNLQQGDQELIVLATHWTSRVSDEAGEGRGRYADAIYHEFQQLYQVNPKVKLLVCGDFNDNPADPSVTKHLHAVGDPA